MPDSTLFKFLITGAISVAADFSALTLLVGLGVHPLAANMMSFPVGVATNYTLHRRWTFRSTAPIPGEAAQFMGVVLVGVAIAQAIMLALVSLGSHYISAKLVSIVVVFGWNYLMNRGWVFR